MTTPAVDTGLLLEELPKKHPNEEDPGLAKQNGKEKVDDDKRPYPPAFYSVETGLLMTNPVVNAEGESLDKSDLAKDADINAYFPNRALQSIIEHHMALEEDTLRGSLRRLDSKVRSSLSHVVASSAFRGLHKPLAAEYYCPILCELMSDPVVTREGVTYEREAIEKWIRQHGTSPMTRQPLSMQDLRPNWAIYDLMEWQEGRGEASIHPSVRRWKATKKDSKMQRPQRGVANAMQASAEGEEEVGCLTCIFASIMIVPLIVAAIFFYILYGILVVLLVLCCCVDVEDQSN